MCVCLDERSYTHTPRLFHMTSSSSSVFDVSEVLNPARTDDDDGDDDGDDDDDICVLMPFIQEDLYSASQPGS